jgi:hypothetical protein
MKYRKPICGTLAEEASRFAQDKKLEIISEFRERILALKPDLSEREIDEMVRQAMREAGN